jgi:hypothetical protein
MTNVTAPYIEFGKERRSAIGGVEFRRERRTAIDDDIESISLSKLGSGRESIHCYCVHDAGFDPRNRRLNEYRSPSCSQNYY